MPKQQQDKWSQFAVTPAKGDDKWSKFATTPSPSAEATPNANPMDALSKATGIGPGPGKAGQVMQQIKGGLTAAQPGEGLKRQPTAIGNIAELAGFLGDTTATFGTAEALAGKALKAIPVANRAVNAFNEVAAVANPIALDTTKIMNVADRALELGKRGHKPPQVISDFATRVGTGDPITFKEARDFYSAATSLSAQEVQETKAIMKGQLGKFTRSLHESLTEAAGKVEKGDMYAKAVREYGKAKSIYRAAKRVAKVAIPAVGAGLLGAEAYKYGRAGLP